MMDHPRIRGEHSPPVGLSSRPHGSSPHTRGALARLRRVLEIQGIIPAYAGSTQMTAHNSGAAAGSSPHTRGAHRRRPARRHGDGIIPAYAGSTGERSGFRPTPRDHPRIRGEHLDRGRALRREVGSSPHTRGAPSPTPTRHATTRIIPAYAGSTRTPHCTAVHGPDHPRIRGEHSFRTSTDTPGAGSSPHTRGALTLLQRTLTQRRIIPAYAGSTLRRASRISGTRDHPRIRGEHSGVMNITRLSGWIIPAYAGSTPAGIPWSSPSTDHPRIRGEHRQRPERGFGCEGSSPHTRGALHTLCAVHQVRRIIPAYAGSTSTAS